MKTETFLCYEYPIKHPDGHIYMGSYTVKQGCKKRPNFKDQKLVSKFQATVLEEGDNILTLLEKEGF